MAGGLATTTTVCRADLWRMGQCRPGDSILFKRISWDSALAVRQRTEKFVDQLNSVISGKIDASQVEPLDISVGDEWDETILHDIRADDQKGTVQVKFRQVRREETFLHASLISLRLCRAVTVVSKLHMAL
jgi:urea carboxylase